MLRVAAGRMVEISITNWGGTFVAITGDFDRAHSRFIIVTEPLDGERTLCQGIVFAPRIRNGILRRLTEPLALSIRRFFTYGYLKDEANRLLGTRYNPATVIAHDADMISFFHWVISLPQRDGSSLKVSGKRARRRNFVMPATSGVFGEYMKKLLFAVLVTLLSAGAVSAQTPAEATHNALRAMRDGLMDAVNKGDIDREVSFLATNVVVTWHDATVSRGRNGVRDYYNKMMNGPTKAVADFHADVNVDELTILYGDSTGIAFGSSVEHFKLVNGKSF